MCGRLNGRTIILDNPPVPEHNRETEQNSKKNPGNEVKHGMLLDKNGGKTDQDGESRAGNTPACFFSELRHGKGSQVNADRFKAVHRRENIDRIIQTENNGTHPFEKICTPSGDLWAEIDPGREYQNNQKADARSSEKGEALPTEGQGICKADHAEQKRDVEVPQNIGDDENRKKGDPIVCGAMNRNPLAIPCLGKKKDKDYGDKE